MAIITQPTNTVTTTYRPLVWVVNFTAFTPDSIKNCVFSIFVNSTLIAQGRKAVSYTAPSFLGPTGTEYFFEVDIQQYLQRYYSVRGRRSTFGDLNTATQTENTDSFDDVYVEFQYEQLNGTTGKLETLPAVDTSSTYYTGIPTRQNGETQNLDDYYGVPFITNAKSYLTKSPLELNVSQTENAFLSILGQWNYTKVTTYTSAGAVINNAYFPTGLTGYPAMGTIGVGKPQLDAVTNWWSSIAPNWTNCAYYTVESGLGLVLGPGSIIFINNSDVRTYTFVADCNKKLRFHWTNLLGGVDSYNFSFKELAIRVVSEVFEKPLSTPHLQDDYGKARTNIKADKSYQCSQIFTNSEMAWIKDLFYSVEVYIENPEDNSQYWRVWLSDITVTEKKHPGLFEVTFTVNLSQDIVTHRI